MNQNPTKKQVLLLDFIESFSERNGYSPSYREIMRAMELKSVSAVAEHVENCVAAGFLRKAPKAARSLEVIRPEKHEETVRLFQEKIEELRGNKKADEVKMLEKAAKILGIDLSLKNLT